jgi:hypothetical protein
VIFIWQKSLQSFRFFGPLTGFIDIHRLARCSLFACYVFTTTSDELPNNFASRPVVMKLAQVWLTFGGLMSASGHVSSQSHQTHGREQFSQSPQRLLIVWSCEINPSFDCCITNGLLWKR